MATWARPYSIDHPDEFKAAVHDEWKSGRGGERLLGYVGTNSKDVAYAVDNPEKVANAAYDEWASGRAGERVLNTVGLTGDEVVFILDNPDVLGNALHDEWASGRAGERLILYGQGVYEGGREVIGEGAGLIQDGGAYIYIVTVHDNYREVAGAYTPGSKIISAYKNSDDPGATTALLLNNLKNLPGQFAQDMANDPRAAGHTVGAFAVPLAIPKGIGVATRTIPKVPGLQWTGTRLTLPGRTTACGTTGAVVVNDLQAIQRAGGSGASSTGAAGGAISTEARVVAAADGSLTLKVATQPRGLRINGQLIDDFHPYKVGPLKGSTGLAETFSGGKYAVVKVNRPITVYRLHNKGVPTKVWNPSKGVFETTRGASETGAFWSLERPAGSMAARIDGAVLPQWGNPMTHMTAVELPAGTVIYVGEVGSQGGFFVGGGSQVVIQNGVKTALQNGAKIVERTVLPR